MSLENSLGRAVSDSSLEQLRINLSLNELIRDMGRVLGKGGNDTEMQTLQRIVDLALEHHKGNKRLNGETEVSHPLGVARIIFYEWRVVDISLIAASLLHEIPPEVLGGEFPREVIEIHQGARLIKGLSDEQGIREALAQSDFAAADQLVMRSPNFQSVLLRLADRLHNCRTIKGLSSQGQFKFAQEVVGLYAPVADYLGLGQVVAEFNDTALQIVYPDESFKIHQTIEAIYKEVGGRENYLSAVGERIRNSLAWAQMTVVRLDSRSKSEASILKKRNRYRKEERQDRVDIATFSDLTGSRIVVPTEAQCRRVLAILKNEPNFALLEDRTDDYLGERQRASGYQALHAVVRFKGGPLHEVQILTPEMFTKNQWGSASHLRAYEASGKTGKKRADPTPWQKTVALFYSSLYQETASLFHLAPLHSKVMRRSEGRPREVIVHPPKKSLLEYEKSLDMFCDYLKDLLKEFGRGTHFFNLVYVVLKDKQYYEGKEGLKRTIRLALEETCFFWKRNGGTPEDLLFFLRRGGARTGNILARIANNIVGISDLERREKNHQLKDFIEIFPFQDWIDRYHVPWRIKPESMIEEKSSRRPHRSYLDLRYKASFPYTK